MRKRIFTIGLLLFTGSLFAQVNNDFSKNWLKIPTDKCMNMGNYNDPNMKGGLKDFIHCNFDGVRYYVYECEFDAVKQGAIIATRELNELGSKCKKSVPGYFYRICTSVKEVPGTTSSEEYSCKLGDGEKQLIYVCTNTSGYAPKVRTFYETDSRCLAKALK